MEMEYLMDKSPPREVERDKDQLNDFDAESVDMIVHSSQYTYFV